MKKHDSNIQVAIRVRPLLEKEIKNSEYPIITVEDNIMVVFDPVNNKYEGSNKKLDIYHRSREQNFAFDKIFTNEKIDHIYNNTASSLVDSLFKGYNGCVFAYGATGTGKTHTMLGSNNTLGLCNYSLSEIFKKIDNQESQDREFEVYVSYVEIYNELIRDLLNNKQENNYLDLRDDSIKGVHIAGVTEIKANNVDEIMNLLLSGNKKRTTEATNANQTSSRSHAVLQVSVISNPKTKNINIEKIVAKLSLIDLAGSERGTVTENRGIRLREGAKINQSLLALANCINALGDKNKKGNYIPYRDSKLTRLLKDSLGGNCKTVMIVTVSPSSSQFEETVNTLKYANRAKNIKTKPIENKKLVEFHIAEYKNIINDLRDQVDSLRDKLKNNKNSKQKDNLDNYCKCREIDEKQVQIIKQELFDNFEERIQLRRALCEIEALNQMNLLEIQKGQNEIMRFTLSSSGKLIEKNNNLPDNLQHQMNDIEKIRASVDFNINKKENMKIELQQKSNDCNKLLEEIPKRVKHNDKIEILELFVKNHILELENEEYQYKLKLQENMNKILMQKIKKLKNNHSDDINEVEDYYNKKIEDEPKIVKKRISSNNKSLKESNKRNLDNIKSQVNEAISKVNNIQLNENLFQINDTQNPNVNFKKISKKNNINNNFRNNLSEKIEKQFKKHK